MKTVKQLLQESKKQTQSLFEQRKYNHFLMTQMFKLDENSQGEQTQEVVDLINSDTYETDAAAYHKSFKLSKHEKMLTPYEVSDFKKMKVYKVKGYNIGFALKEKDGKYQEIVAVHNNEPNVRGVGELLVQSAIRLGGVYLDHYDGFLTKFYQKLGFVEYDRDAYDPQYDPDGSFRKKYGAADIIYRKLKNK